MDGKERAGTDDTVAEETVALIGRIEAAEEKFVRLHARDRSVGLFSINLTIQQLKTLVLINIEGPMAINELAEALGVGLATASGNIDRLAAQGLVDRREDRTDRRIRRIGLTDEGARVLGSFMDAGRDHRRRVLRRLSPVHLRNLADAMDALADAMQAEMADNSPDREA